ncbi:MAG: hypothetical protein HC862_23530 [Scytonema sp. RU_4_4]|nr:hypothetical protein [Scytonema sp. RU_4_4]NJR75244.1 hypothetical protein [Scytonema sp. CRU_2_7]
MWWLFANVLAWVFGLLVAFTGAGIVKEGLSIQTALLTAANGATIGTTVGIMTGIALVVRLKPPRKQSH